MSDLIVFQKQTAFQTGVLALMTGLKVQATELLKLKQMFIGFDTNQDGYLSLKELRNGMIETLGSLKAQASDW